MCIIMHVPWCYVVVDNCSVYLYCDIYSSVCKSVPITYVECFMYMDVVCSGLLMTFDLLIANIEYIWYYFVDQILRKW